MDFLRGACLEGGDSVQIFGGVFWLGDFRVIKVILEGGRFFLELFLGGFRLSKGALKNICSVFLIHFTFSARGVSFMSFFGFFYI